MFVTGTNYRESEPVYPTQNTEWNGIFPDGTPFQKDKPPNYVFVWKTWGKNSNGLNDNLHTI